MDPIIENDWLNPKPEVIEEVKNVPNITRSWLGREMQLNLSSGPSNKTVLENMAEDILIRKTLTSRSCELPGYVRSTFLMVFSPDGTKIASTHGNHNVYVSELASGKHVRILSGHPRTPWCIAFHPSHPQIIGSGCLGGQVRVWDLSGGSEVWTVSNETVIASIAFHPRDQLLVIATYNELYFWDWSRPVPFAKVCTKHTNEKVRYVAFDSLGTKLITGISVWGSSIGANPTSQNTPPNQGSPSNNRGSPGDQRPDNPGDRSENRSQDTTRSTHDMVFNSYHNLVQRYDSLVRNYRRLFLARHRLTGSPVNTTDRGTDPMETDTSVRAGQHSRTVTSSRNWSMNDNDAPPRRPSHGDSGDGEGSSSRLLSLDVLSINGDPSRSVDTNENDEANESDRLFGSGTSAFQRFHEELNRESQNADRPTRLLPNPFSASASVTRPHHNGSSRTSVFTSRRHDSPSARYFLQRRRNAAQNNIQTSTSTNTSPQDEELSRSLLSESRRRSSNRSGRPTMTNSSTQFSPAAEQTINESLDLIRDILRDSGTRLLNLITNMSLSTLANVERSIPRRQRNSLTESDGNDWLNSSLRRDLLISESDTDSDHSAHDSSRTSSAHDESTRTTHLSHDHSYHSTRRLEIDLSEDLRSDEESLPNGPNRVNISTSGRFRVRSHSTEENGTRDSNVRNQRTSANVDSSRPSTSRDTSWMNESLHTDMAAMSSSDAIAKVRTGVQMLQRHTLQLTEMWLRGNPTSLAELRNMWENLRRRFVTLSRTNIQAPPEVPGYFTRSLLDRCRALSESIRNNRNRNMRHNSDVRERARNRTNEDNQRAQTSTDSTSSSIATETENTTSNVGTRSASGRNQALRRILLRLRTTPTTRRRVPASHRWRNEEEPRRRTRTPLVRWCLRHAQRPGRRDISRSFEVHCTRHEIRMRAMQVLSIMFNMMMNCLERRALSQIIILMLKTLKKALALTCLMLVTNRLTRRTNETQTLPRGDPTDNQSEPGPSQESQDAVNDAEARTNRLNVLNNITRQRIVDRNNDSTSSWPEFSDSEDEDVPRNKKIKVETTTPKDDTKEAEATSAEPSSSSQNSGLRWSNRLAVQIATANRNNSVSARRRRDSYTELKRQEALHRTNPAAHPIVKRKLNPPTSTHRIPVMRRLPPTARKPKEKPVSQSNRPAQVPNDEPVAGPSNSQPGPSGDNSSSPQDGASRTEPTMQDFEQRVNLVRIAHMHAVRMRNAARNRFRRLQTIRLYTPSSVREMFALQSNNNDQPAAAENQPPMNNAAGDAMYQPPFSLYRPHILTARSDQAGRGERHYDYVIPLVDEGPSNDGPNVQHRIPNVHGYVQPILITQNALVVEEGGGLGGLLEGGALSEALPPSVHRVQAWDFSTGEKPDIADDLKNVVVPRCRIHNDASIDISKDGKLLVALLPIPRFRNGHLLGIYSLEWSRLGQCLHTAVLEQSAVSVALSPTARHLAVGLGSRRFTTLSHARNNVFALLYNITGNCKSSRSDLTPVKELEQNWEQGFTSLNCLRWAPQPGQGLVYANNTGQLIIMS